MRGSGTTPAGRASRTESRCLTLPAPPGPRPTIIWIHGRTVSKELDPGRYLRWLRAGPTPGNPPGGLGVRVDSAAYSGYRIPPFYDSLIGKLIVHGKNRTECLMRLRRSLSEFVIDGIETTIPLFQSLVNEQDIINGDYSIHWLEKFLKQRAA